MVARSVNEYSDRMGGAIWNCERNGTCD